MSQGCLILDISGEFSVTYTSSGIARFGVLYPLPNAAPTTSASGCGYLPTPNCPNGGGTFPKDAVKRVPTPTANDAKNSTLPHSQIKRDNLPGHLLRCGEEVGGRLNPNWVEWLMGWPIGWTGLRRLEMGKFRRWWSKHGGV